MAEQDLAPSDREELDFDGGYSRTYSQTIRNSAPGYDALIEIAAAALEQAVPQATSILVVGPELGEELVPLPTALPQARFTLLEPSALMREACTREIDAAGAWSRPFCRSNPCAAVSGSAVDRPDPLPRWELPVLILNSTSVSRWQHHTDRTEFTCGIAF